MPVNPTWAASLEKQLRETQEALRQRDPAEVALWSGARCETLAGETRLEILFWGRPYLVTWPDLTVRDKEGQPCPAHFAGIILQHLLLADGAPVENTWVSLRNLPHGAFYEQAFQSYSGNLLVRSFRGDVEAFRATARGLGGEQVEMGDAAFRFWVFPRLPLAVVYWSGGGEFPDSAQVLFDNSASHYHHLEILAHLGGMLCERLVEFANKRSTTEVTESTE
jgi:hypothetical protein